MRQLTFAVASCGSALLACPPARRVATHVVRIIEFQYGTCDARRAAAARSGRRLTDELHVGRDLRVGFDQRGSLEVLSRDVVQLDGEVELGEARQRLRQVIDRVVLHGHRAVAAGIHRLELEILVHLLARLYLVGQVLALAARAPAAFIDCHLGIDQIAMVLHQPVDAVELTAFLVGGQRENQIALGREVLFFQANQVGQELRGHALVVARAASVEPAVMLQKREGIDRPILPLRLDDVEVSEQQQRPPRTGAAPSRDEVVLPRIRPDHLQVAVGPPGSLQPRGGGLRRGRNVARRRVRRVDVDQFLEDRACALFVRRGLRRSDRRTAIA